VIVIDATVLAGFLRKEPDWEKLVNYIKNGISVDLIVKEVNNILWKDIMLEKAEIKIQCLSYIV
jgi:predicted nucleic acid-binding protein